MILLPTKFLRADRTLIFIGGEVIALLVYGPRSPENICFKINDGRHIPVNFDTVVLALAFLYTVGAIIEDSGMIRLATPAIERLDR
jgi:hypothetical protein